MWTTWSKRNPSRAYEFSNPRRLQRNSNGLGFGRGTHGRLYMSPTDWYFKRNKRKNTGGFNSERKLHIVSYDHFWKHLCAGFKFSNRDLSSFSKLLIFFGIVGIVFGITTSIVTHFKDNRAFRVVGFVSYGFGALNMFFGIMLSRVVYKKNRVDREDINRRRRIVRDQSGIICNGNIGRIPRITVDSVEYAEEYEEEASSEEDEDTQATSAESQEPDEDGQSLKSNIIQKSLSAASFTPATPERMLQEALDLQRNKSLPVEPHIQNDVEETNPKLLRNRATKSTPSVNKISCSEFNPEEPISEDEDALLYDSMTNQNYLKDSTVLLKNNDIEEDSHRPKPSSSRYHRPLSSLAKRQLSKSTNDLISFADTFELANNTNSVVKIPIQNKITFCNENVLFHKKNQGDLAVNNANFSPKTTLKESEVDSEVFVSVEECSHDHSCSRDKSACSALKEITSLRQEQKTHISGVERPHLKRESRITVEDNVDAPVEKLPELILDCQSLTPSRQGSAFSNNSFVNDNYIVDILMMANQDSAARKCNEDSNT